MDRSPLRYIPQSNIIDTIFNQIAVDVAKISIRHVRCEIDKTYIEDLPTGLNDCLTVAPNMDQTPRSFMQDLCLTILEEGVAAIVPTDYSKAPVGTNSYDVYNLRVGRITQFKTSSLIVDVYNEKTGRREPVELPKRLVAVVQNPLASITSSRGSLASRLSSKLRILDSIDNAAAGKKLDLIVQLPYTVRTERRKEEAEKRMKDVERQLSNGQFGIAYMDAAEKFTQLNRPAENNLLEQIKYLTQQLYNTLGMPEAVFNGTADEQTMLNYYNRTIEPIVAEITLSMAKTFITKTARTQGQTVDYFRDPFQNVSITKVSEIAQAMVTTQIMTPNEVRSYLGLPRSEEPVGDSLSNPNINPMGDASMAPPEEPTEEEENDGFDV
jgi:phage portal protein